MVQITDMLGRAFHNDPLSIYVYPKEAERKRCMPLVLDMSLRYARRYGEVNTTPEGTGAACWLIPNKTTVSTWGMIRVGALAITLKVEKSGIQRFNKVSESVDRIHKRCISEPHWYLWVMGVDPDCQGQGIGSRLLREGLERVDASHMPCYLETMNPKNLPLYQRFGFVVANEETIPDTNLHMWSMIRPAHS